MRLWVVKISSQLSYDPEHLKRERSYLKSLASSGTTIELVCPENKGVDQLYNRSRNHGGPTGLDFALLQPYILRKIKEGEERGFDAVIVHCNSDPGVEAARHIVDIPVIGPGRVACHLAAMLAHQIGIIAPTQIEIPDLRRLLREYHLEHFVVDILTLDTAIEEAHQQSAQIRERFCERSRELIAKGAEMILSSCSVFVPVYFSPQEIAQEIRAPVLDPIGIAIGMAELCVRLGIKHSQITYPRPIELQTEDLGMFNSKPT
jgi:allantoin racemase